MASSSSAEQHKYKRLRKSLDDFETALPATALSPQPVRPFESLVLNPPALLESTTGRNPSPYDVFICHHGNDTEHTLAKTIYERLQASRKSVFLDREELELGAYFPLDIKNAIDTASFHIVIFSPKFAKSPWCLEEVRLMLQRSITFIPNFYQVEPYILRWALQGKGNGIYADDISELENKKRYNNDQLKEWKVALHQAASFYTGEIINEQHDKKAVQAVVDRVLQRTLDAGKHAVGLDELKKEFDEKIAHRSKPIQIVGISGTGGAGKTTLARHIYKKRKCMYTQTCFLFNVREAARKDLMYEKQNELLKDLKVHTESKDVKNIDYGKIMSSSQLKKLKVLIVLDNVDHTNQLDALLPVKENFEQGSLIIVTTCKDQVLKEWGISCIYQIPKLTPDHAHQLFCWHAFGHPSPSVELKELAEKFTNACDRLPLFLVVLGSQLYGLSESDWQSQFKILSEIVSDDISRIQPNDILNISYNALNDNEPKMLLQKMFLDIACFFDGWPCSEVIATWNNFECNGFEYNGWHNLQKLVNKCFIETYEKDDVTRIRVSDHLREFGREIANKHSSLRLWSKDQIITIQHEEAIQIRGMADAFGQNWYLQDGEIILRTSQEERKVAPRSLGLEIFIGKGDFINEECSDISRELVFFCCDSFLHENLPSWLPLGCLRILQLSEPQKLKELWEHGENAPSQLKQLRISNGYKLKSISALQRLTSLEKLTISDCTELKTIPSLAEPTFLKEINLIRCNKLEKIECLRSLTSLETIIIHDCTELNTLSSLGEATSLKKFDLRGCNKLKQIESLGRMTSLETVVIYNCSELKTLPSLSQATSLETLHLDRCDKLEINERLDRKFRFCVQNCPAITCTIYSNENI